MAELEPGRVVSCRCVCVCLQVEEVDARARRGVGVGRWDSVCLRAGRGGGRKGSTRASASASGILDEERDGGRRRRGRADEWLRRRQRRRGHLQPRLRRRTRLLLGQQEPIRPQATFETERTSLWSRLQFLFSIKGFGAGYICNDTDWLCRISWASCCLSTCYGFKCAW